MAGKNGGARPGAGRPRKSDKLAGQVAKAEKTITDRLPRLLANLLKLADGGFERVEEEWAPDVPDYEDDGPTPLVLVKRKVSYAEPDRAANQYLIDRVLGRPTERHEVAGEDGGPLVIRVEYADCQPDAPAAPPGPEVDPLGDGPV